MNIYLKYLFVLMFSTLIASAFDHVFGADDSGNTVEEESPEIELMRLQFEYECEISPTCREKLIEKAGNKKLVFKTYKTGTATSEAVLSTNGEVRFVDSGPGE